MSPYFSSKKTDDLLSHRTLIQVMTLFSYRLVTTTTLSPFQRSLCSAVFFVNSSAKNYFIRASPLPPLHSPLPGWPPGRSAPSSPSDATACNLMPTLPRQSFSALITTPIPRLKSVNLSVPDL